MICTVCKEEKTDKHFHADNKTGYSKLCLSCRKKRNSRVYTRRYRLKQKLMAEIKQADKAQVNSILAEKIKSLNSQFHRFTLSNRARIKQLQVLMQNESPDPRTVEAFERRNKFQLEAMAIYSGQVQMVSIGITPKPINELWRMNHGTNPRRQSEEENQTDIGRAGDLSLLTVYGGNG